MLAQHLITRPVFDALFSGYSFAEHNPVSKAMQAMLDALDEQNVEGRGRTLEKFYESVRLRAEGIDNAEGKQKIIIELYEKFFKLAFPRAAESLGIVYTPVEIVDFIIRSVDQLLRTEFGASLSDEGVHILDPFTGTGTFITRLLQSGLIRPEDLLRKYTQNCTPTRSCCSPTTSPLSTSRPTYHGTAHSDGTPTRDWLRALRRHRAHRHIPADGGRRLRRPWWPSREQRTRRRASATRHPRHHRQPAVLRRPDQRQRQQR